MNPIVLFCLIGVAVATQTGNVGGYGGVGVGGVGVGGVGGQYPIYGKGFGFRSEVVPEVVPEVYKSEVGYPLHHYGRYPYSYKTFPYQYGKGYEYPTYGKQYYSELPYFYSKYQKEYPVYGKSFYPEFFRHFPYLQHQYPVEQYGEYYNNYEYPSFPKYFDYPYYNRYQHESPVYHREFPWGQYQNYHHEYPVYKTYPFDYHYNSYSPLI